MQKPWHIRGDYSRAFVSPETWWDRILLRLRGWEEFWNYRLWSKPSRALRHALDLGHKHAWGATRINPYFLETEQRCSKCKQYRHHMYKDVVNDEPVWKEGRHPLNNKQKER
jgi:hypothetical protein